ncbi:MAG TPA: CARDB domain-containing protein [Polyangiaceae bacterium]|nr:CARDB domain-containing protein [Polyangiaceae bacterium]
MNSPISSRFATLSGSLGLLALVSACSGNPQVIQPSTTHGGAGNGGGSSDFDGGTGATLNFPDGGGSGGSSGEGGTSHPCGASSCGIGQRCAEADGGTSCVDVPCSELTCGATEECAPAPGGGNHCKSIACNSDVQCPASRYCDGTKCVDDACVPRAGRCDGNEVLVCSENGSGETSPFTCGSPAYFTSTCSDASGASGCTCEDDWDCPQYTDCAVGLCSGTGVEPTCKLPPTPFTQVLPQREFHWGGTEYAGDTGSDPSEDDAVGSPFPWSAQASTVPIVANLDDDNGDGLVNEEDFPEIVFMTYHGDNPNQNGVVRAIHGGGPNKGKDYFALCADNHWIEGSPLPTTGKCATEANANDANSRSCATVAVGDIDGDGFPEIVVPIENGGIEILDNKGEPILSTGDIRPATFPWNYPGPAIVNLDLTGFAEVVVGNRVLTFKAQGTSFVVDKIFAGKFRMGTQFHDDEAGHHGPMVCPADLTSDPGLEVVAGTSVYRLPDRPADCNGANATTDYCTNTLTLVWDGQAQNPGKIADDQADGFCAVADVLGADTANPPGPSNPLDRVPEVIVIADGHLLVFESATGHLAVDRELETVTDPRRQGGAPNVDDFDGDGFPEIGTAMPYNYQVVDLQATSANCPAWTDVLDKSGAPPQTNPARNPGAACTKDADCNAGAVCNVTAGTCTCLHNSWKRQTEDDSSRVTSSSVFDFNGDGAAEVVYNDECYFRVYDGATGRVYLQLPSMSRTIVENPVIADVDNDGNSEIVFSQNNDQVTARCSEALLDSWPNGNDDVVREKLGNGIDVWGDPTDLWVAARRVWNQNAYHVTNVTEGGSIPTHEPESWKPYNGRIYDTYRSQPRNYGVAPDLALTGLQVSSPDAACGTLSDTLTITVEVKNLGDLRAGAGVVIDFFGTFAGTESHLADAAGADLVYTLPNSLEPGGTVLVSVEYERGNGGKTDLPTSIRATVDGGNEAATCTDCGSARECNEGNNEISGDVKAGAAVADLVVSFDGTTACTNPKVTLTVKNAGSLPVSNVLVRVYAGDPNGGGKPLGEGTIAGPIAAGATAQVTVSFPSLTRSVTLWAVVDPNDAIEECDNGNNVTRGPQVRCGIR